MGAIRVIDRIVDLADYAAYDASVDSRDAAVQSAASSDATSKASAAQAAAIAAASSDATSKAGTAQANAIASAASDATTKANAAQSTAISTASSDATSKANTAQSNAISTASGDATSKANAAQAAAIAAAASDATTKANQAKADAIAVDPVKASAAEVITGTNDTKFVTPKALSDAGIGGGVRRYHALLDQVGTGDPVANILENTLGETPVWARVGVGHYEVSLLNAPKAKTIRLIGSQSNDINAAGVTIFEEGGDGLFIVLTFDLTGTPVDEAMVYMPVMIWVYP